MTLLPFLLAAAAQSPVQQEMYHALSVRHPAPDCATISAMSEDPVTDLLYLVDNAILPAWVGMRAAGCLLSDHAEAAQPQILSWVQSEQTRGLAILTLGQLDALPQPMALQVAQAALSGPLVDTAQPRIAASERAELRALVSE